MLSIFRKVVNGDYWQFCLIGNIKNVYRNFFVNNRVVNKNYREISYDGEELY